MRVKITPLLLLLGMMAANLSAIEITVVNFSGEINDGVDRQSISNPGVTGWDGVGQVINDRTAPDNGDWRLSIEDSGGIYNMTDYAIRAGDTFTLTFDSSTFFGLPLSVIAQLYVDEDATQTIISSESFNFAVVVINSWETFTHVFTVPEDADYLGNTIGIQFTGPDSGDSKFESVDDVHLFVDAAGGITITPTEVLRIFERDQSTQTIDLTLLSQPGHDVTVTVTAVDDLDISLVGALPDGSLQLDFSTDDWDLPQPVTIQAIDDALQEGTESAKIDFTCTSSDPVYNGLSVDDYAITVIDDDQAGITIENTEDLTVSEDGSVTAEYDLFIHKLPTDYLWIQFADIADTDQLTISPAVLTITADNWYVPWTITIEAIDDTILESAEHNTEIAHIMLTNDTDYTSLEIANVQVKVLENECGAWGYEPADINQNCVVDLYDLAMMLSEWLNCSWPYEVGCINYGQL